MNSFLTWVGGLLAAILAALFAVPYFVDWNGYRGVFEEEVSRVLGRSVRVRGDVNLRLLPAPYVRFEKIRIADTTGLTGAPFFQAESFTMWLSVPPLLSGVVEAERIELDRPVVRLAARNEGAGNWSGFQVRSGSLPFAPAGVTLDSVDIVDGTVSFDLEGAGRLSELSGINGEFVAETLSGPFTFSGGAQYGSLPFQLNVATDELDARGNMRVKVRAKSAKSRVIHFFNGQLYDLNERPRLAGRLDSKVFVGTKKMRANVPVHASSELSGNTRGGSLKDIRISFESRGKPQTIVGDAQVSWGGRSKLVVSLASQWLDLDRFDYRAGRQRQETVLHVRPVANGAPAPATENDGVTAQDQSSDGKEPSDAGTGTGEAAAASEKSATAKPANHAPLSTLQSLLISLGDVLPRRSDIEAKFRVDQADLGGDSLSDVRLDVRCSGGPVVVETLEARLPGSGRLEFSGEMKRDASGALFSGDVFVGGPSLARVKRWAFDAGTASRVLSDGPFALSGFLTLGADRLAIVRARAEFSGVPVRGAVSWSGHSPHGQLSIDLEGHELDSRWIGIRPVALNEALRAAGGGAEELRAVFTKPTDTDGEQSGEDHEEGRGGDAGGVGKVAIKVKAARLVNGNTVLHNVDAQVSVAGQQISIPHMAFETAEGLEVSLEGDVNGLGAEPAGELRWVASARDRRAVSVLSQLADVGAGGGERLGQLLGSAVPFRLAGKVDLGGRQKGGADIEFDGQARSGRLSGHMLFDGGLGAWQDGYADVTISAQSEQSQALLNLFSLSGRSFSDVRDDGVATTGLFKAVGIPSQDMKAMGVVRSQRLTLIYNGSVATGAQKETPVVFKRGEFVVASNDARDVLALAGLRVGSGAAPVRMDGLIDLLTEDDRLVFRPRDLKFGASTVAGQIAFQTDASGKRRVEGDFIVDKADLVALASVLLSDTSDVGVGDGVDSAGAGGERDTGPTGAADAPKPKRAERTRAAGRRGQGNDGSGAGAGAGGHEDALAPGVRRVSYLFSDAAFDPDMFGAVAGKVGLKVGSFGVGRGLKISDAAIEVALSDDAVTFTVKEGRALGGLAQANVELKKRAAGVDAKGNVRLTDVSLDQLTRWDETGAAIAMASGKGSLSLAFGGQALSPRGLMAVMSGEGELALNEGVVNGLSPALVGAAADEIMAREISADGAQPGGALRKARAQRSADGETSARRNLEAALIERLGEGTLSLGTRKIPIKIVDGAAQFTPFSMKNEYGVTNGRITLDLGQLAVDADFRISASGQGDQQAWPPVTVAFVGPLGKTGALAPLVSVAALEREVMVRKLEQNVQELERLRRLDQEAAKRQREREAERQRELEAARAAAAEEAEDAQAEQVEQPSADWQPLDDGDAGAAVGEPVPGEPPEDSADVVDEDLPAAAPRARRKPVVRKRRPRVQRKSASDVFNQQF